MLPQGTYISPQLIATWFINEAERESGEAMTHLKVQKLIYYAEAWFLANFDRSLIEEDLQAWTHGPVSPSVYAKYRNKRFDALPPERPRALPEGIAEFLGDVYAQYGQFSAKRLEALTHEEDPWRLTRGNLPPEAKCTTPISKLLMRNYYGARIGKKEAKALPN